MPVGPLDFPLWADHKLQTPPGVEVRRGDYLGRTIIVLYNPSERSWAGVIQDSFKPADLNTHLGRMQPAPVGS